MYICVCVYIYDMCIYAYISVGVFAYITHAYTYTFVCHMYACVNVYKYQDLGFMGLRNFGNALISHVQLKVWCVNGGRGGGRENDR